MPSRAHKVFINDRELLYASSDPNDLLSSCARTFLSRHPSERSDDTVYAEPVRWFSFFAEPGKGKGIGVKALVNLKIGTHVGFVEGLVTKVPPSTLSESFSFQLFDSPDVFCDSLSGGSLATFINENIVSPNCTAQKGVFGGKLRIRVVVSSYVQAGTALSLSYRGDVSLGSVLTESPKHNWGKSLAPDGSLSHNTRVCANRRYHASVPAPLTSWLCIDCTSFYGGCAIPLCSEACFRSHVADWASGNLEDRTFCAPRRAYHAKPLLTKAVMPRPSSLK
jgi:hypothetical protein